MPTSCFLPVLDWLLEQGRVSEQPSFSSELLSGGSYGGSAALSFSHPPGIASRMYLGKAVSVLPSKQGLHFCANISLSCVCARASACAWCPPHSRSCHWFSFAPIPSGWDVYGNNPDLLSRYGQSLQQRAGWAGASFNPSPACLEAGTLQTGPAHPALCIFSLCVWCERWVILG